MFRDTQIQSVPMRRRAALAAALALACGATPALAEVGNANAYDLSVSISLLGLLPLNLTPQAQADISAATEPTTDANQLPSLDVGNAALVHVTTGLLVSEAEYRPGVSNSASAAQSQVADISVSAIGLLGLNVLSLSANAISSKSLVVGYCPPPARQETLNGLLDELMFGNGFDSGNLGTGGDGTPGTGPDDSATLADVQLSILGINVPIPLNPPANTGVDLSALGIVGATLILNEQVIGGDGVSSRSKTSNALRLSLNILNVVTGEVILAHSSAEIDCTQ